LEKEAKGEAGEGLVPIVRGMGSRTFTPRSAQGTGILLDLARTSC